MKPRRLIYFIVLISLSPWAWSGPSRYRKGSMSLKSSLKDCGRRLSKVLNFSELESFLEQNCFDDRVSSKNAKLDVDTDYILQDQEICKCLGENKLNMEYLDRKGRRDHKEDEFTLGMIEANAKEKQQRFQNMVEGMTIQSWLISGDKELTSAYVQPPEQNDVQREFDAYLEESRREIKRVGVLLKEKDPKEQLVSEHRLSRIAGLVKGPEETVNPYPSTRVASPQCFSMQSFMTFQQLPVDKEFFRDLDGSLEFKAEEWDLEALTAEYDKAYGEMDIALRKETPDMEKRRARVDSYKAKIVFLKKNPLFSNLFGAKVTDGPKGKDLLARKKELFGIIKRGFPLKDKCGDEDAACLKHFQANEKAYESALGAFFKQPDVMEATRAQGQAMLIKEMKNNQSLTETRLPRTQAGMEKKFETITGGHHISNCSSEDREFNMAHCVQNFSHYCAIAWKSSTDNENEVNLDSFVSPSETLAREMEFDFSTDPGKNTAFQKLSKSLCETPRASRENPQDWATFSQFERRNCRRGESKETCLVQYLEKYKDPGETPHMGEAMAGVLRSHSKAKALSDEEVKDVRSKAVASSEIIRGGATKFFSRWTGMAGKVAQAEGNGMTEARAGTHSPQVGRHMPEDASYAPFIPSLPAAPETRTVATASPVGGALASRKREDKDAEEELMQLRRELNRAKEVKDKEARSLMENRIKQLENLLAKKEAAVGDSRPASVARAKEEVAQKSRATAPTLDSPQLLPRSLNGTSDAPQGTKMANAAGGADRITASPLKSTPARRAELNSALLEKYNVSLTDVGEGQHHLAQEKGMEQLRLPEGVQEAGALPVDVSAAQYAQVKGHDFGSLKEIYEKRIKGRKGLIVKISITTKGESSPLEFFAIREGDSVVFQPVRKIKLESLKQELKN